MFLREKSASGQNETVIVTWDDEDGGCCLIESVPEKPQSSEALFEGLIYQAGSCLDHL